MVLLGGRRSLGISTVLRLSFPTYKMTLIPPTLCKVLGRQKIVSSRCHDGGKSVCHMYEQLCPKVRASQDEGLGQSQEEMGCHPTMGKQWR